MNLKDFLKRVVYREKATSESYIRYLRKMGVNIGEDCIFCSFTVPNRHSISVDDFHRKSCENYSGSQNIDT